MGEQGNRPHTMGKARQLWQIFFDDDKPDEGAGSGKYWNASANGQCKVKTFKPSVDNTITDTWQTFGSTIENIAIHSFLTENVSIT